MASALRIHRLDTRRSERMPSHAGLRVLDEHVPVAALVEHVAEVELIRVVTDCDTNDFRIGRRPHPNVDGLGLIDLR